MARFGFQRGPSAEMIERIVEQTLEKAGLGSAPMSGMPGIQDAVSVPPPMAQSLASQPTLGQTIALPRPASAFDTIMGPGRPLWPQAIDEIDPLTGRAMPRRWQYDVAHNLNLSQTQVPWGVLTSLYENCDQVLRCCEIRVDEVTKMDHSFALSDSCITEIMATAGVNHAKAVEIGREKFSGELAQATEFWENPYPEMYRGFTEWLTEALWSFFPYDAMVLYPRYNLGGKIMGIELIDPRTIKPLLDNRGFTPLPPAPAYQQILFGFPRGEFTASGDSDGEFYGGPGIKGAFKTDQLIYSVKNRRTISPYGTSMVEMMVPAATVYLERQRWMREQFQSGASAATFLLSKEQMTPPQAREWEGYINDYLSGNPALRQQLKVIPFEPSYAPQQEEKYKADLDEFFIKQIASKGGIDPRNLGVVPRGGLGSKGEAGEASDSAELVSQKPTEKHVTDLINRVNRELLGLSRNITFVLHDDKTGQDDLNTFKAQQTAVFGGFKTINEVREENGDPPSTDPEADQLMIVSGPTVQFLTNMLEEQPDGSLAPKPKPVPPQLIGATLANNDNVDDNNRGSQQEEAHGQETPGNGQEKGSPGNGQASGGTGNEQKAALERQTFAKYLDKRAGSGKWRDFTFVHVGPDEAKGLNATGRQLAVGAPSDSPKASIHKRALSDLPGHREKQAIIDHYTAKIAKALSQVSGVTEAVEHALNATRTKAPTPVDPDHAQAVAKGAVHQYVDIQGSALVDAIRQVHGDAGLAGAVNNVGGATLTSDLAQMAAGIDWNTWKPGHPDAALKVAGGRLRDLLYAAHIDIKGIDETTLDRIGDTIARGLVNGDPAKVIGSAINAYLNDPARAQMIATTEGNRAYNASALDNIQSAGFTGWDWLAYDDACDECASIADSNPQEFGDAGPPDHPNCRCSVGAPEAELPGGSDFANASPDSGE